MTITNHFLLHAMGCLSQVAPVSYRRIFHGYGIYHQGVQFAIIVNDQLYFRADEHSRHLYLAKRMSAFQPASVSPDDSHFFQLPDEVLSHPGELIIWIRIAVEAAQGNYSLADDEPDIRSTPVRHLKLR